MISYSEALEKTNEIGTVEELYSGAVVTASGLPHAFPGELVVFEEEESGMVFSLQAESVEILILTQHVPVQSGMKVARTGTPFRLPVGEGLLHTIITPMATTWGNGLPIRGLEEERGVDQEPAPLQMRKNVDRNFVSGVTAIDMVVPLGFGQRELVIGDHKVGKTQFLLQALTAHVERGGVGVYCGIAKRATEIAAFTTFQEQKGIADKTVFLFAGSADPPGMVYLAPYSAMTIAEYFKDRGKDVLLILDDLTIHAKYYREISLLSRRYPGRSAYPGDIFSIHARLMERAGQFKQGSITCLPVAESVLSDISGYIQTNLMSMTDGHIFFDNELFNQGKRPAVNPFLSVTRVGRQTQSPLLRTMSREVSGFLVEHEKLKDLVHFGGELTDRVKKGLDKGSLLETVFNQPDDLVIPLPISVLLIGMVWAGILEIQVKPHIPYIRQRLLDAYLGDKGWETYMNGLLTMSIFSDLNEKILADKSLLFDLIKLPR